MSDRNGRRPEEKYLSPRNLQLVGVFLLLASAAFWGLTGRESVLIMSSAMTLIATGAYRGASKTLERAESEIRDKLK